MDEKQTVDTSTTDSAKSENVVTEAKADGRSDTGDEDLNLDLFETEKKTVPYTVFKERNAKLREAERKLKTIDSDVQRRVQDEVYRREMELRRHYESRLAGQSQDVNDFTYGDETAAPSKEVELMRREIQTLKQGLNEVSTASEQDRIRREVTTLKHEFPALDEEHVYAIKRARPEWSWEECAEHSHNKFKTHLETKWKELVEKKKVASTKKVVGAEGLRNLKPEDRPKTWADARKKMADYYKD